ncbi:hypothetical protein C8R45DRAFT_1183967 [Mycena sanguinolenta]|nr:hypothetical protein C8R45DRAFT_1183967 [Mycena sanguinolenta]
MSSVDPATIVTKEEFEAKVAETYAKCKAIETPPSEKRILANLLGLTPEAVGKTTVSFPDGGDACESCGHAITFLDVAAAGLKTHIKEFMAEIITGKHGYIVNSDPDHSGVPCRFRVLSRFCEIRRAMTQDWRGRRLSTDRGAFDISKTALLWRARAPCSD